MKDTTTITIRTITWKDLARLKLEHDYRNFDSLLSELINISKFLKSGELHE